MSEWPLALQKIIEDFQDCFDRMERYELLFQYAKRMPHPLPNDEWTEDNRVQGCQSEAHVECIVNSETGFHIRGAADAQLVQGLMAVLAIGVDGLSPNEVAKLTPKFVDEMNVKASLTPSRANGFLNLFEMIRAEAEKHTN